ncbi:uncharacterized protein LOC135848895 [Planococcus citri]|uniref:uncharacterized protein LOC135848895 n=1 Tax=Planococcus citri TaxID=170843 RepID=UPI0031F9F211
MNSYRYFSYYITLWCCYYTAKVHSWKQKPLIFNYGTEKLMEVNDNDDSAKCTSCLTACPDSSRLVKEVSISGYGLILQQVYDAENPKKITKICNNLPTPSIIYDTMDEDYEIGYELFYKEGDVTLSFQIYEELNKVINGEPNTEKRALVNNDYISTYYEQEPPNSKFKVQGEQTEIMVFYWIPVMTVELNPSTHSRKIFFSTDIINDYFHKEQVASQCDNYYLSVGSQISTLKRQSIFDWIFSKQPVDENRLEKTQILPMHMLHTLPGRLATCMYVNVAFIWSSIANGQLQKVDLLLYALYKLWPSNIKIAFGVANEYKSEGIDPKLLKRDKENKIFLKYPVPKIMYRMVEWVHETGFIHTIVIVIHNNLKPVQPEDRICSATDEVLGWDEVKNITDTGTTTGTSYTCPMSKEVIDQLGFKEEYVRSPFSLIHFPKVNESDEDRSYINVQDEVLDEFNRLRNLKK